MDIFLPVLFVSLLVTTLLIFFAFFPIKISWFYQTPKPPKPAKPSYDFRNEYKAYSDTDNYDDAEL